MSKAPIDIEDGPVLETATKPEKEIQLLKREIDLLGLHNDRRASAFGQDIRYLQEKTLLSVAS